MFYARQYLATFERNYFQQKYRVSGTSSYLTNDVNYEIYFFK